MDIQAAENMLTNALNGFHGRFKQVYGQACVRVDGRSYLSTGSNKLLSDIDPSSYELCDINAGELGAIFRSRSDINSIIFGCTPDIVRVSEEARVMPVSLEDLARLTGSRLKVVPDASAAGILSGLEDASVCLIKGTGAIAVGSNCRKAVAGIQIVKKSCEARLYGKKIGGAVPIRDEVADRYRRNFISDYTKRNEAKKVEYIGFDEKEFSLRSNLIEHGKELVKRDLTYGSWGNLSLKLNDDEMLITPSSMDFFDISIEDIVKVNIRTLEYGNQRMPSSEVRLHAAAYLNLPDCGAVITTRSNGISVFAACKAGFALGEGELQDLIGDVQTTAYAPPGTAELARAVVTVLKDTHACVIPHHGGVFYGPSLEVVLAVADAVEKKARNLLGF